MTSSGSDYSSDDNFYGENDDDGEVEPSLKPCTNCGRNFNPDVLSRHVKICTNLKNRKAFDSKKQRLAEIEKIPVTTKPAAPSGRAPGKKKNWRLQHEQFIKNIRAARGGKQGNSPEPSSVDVNPDYIQCPHCNRRFNEGAADRHIEFCKEQKSRIPKTLDPKFSHKKESQDKRSSYRPPLPGSNKKKAPVREPAAKPRSTANSAPTSERMKNKTSPSSHNEVARRGTVSDTAISGQRKKISQGAQEQQHVNNKLPNSNERYSKANVRKPSGASLPDSEKNKCENLKGVGNEPKWFEELKRNDSDNQLYSRKINEDLDAVDSGKDLNENYPLTTLLAKKKNGNYTSPVGVVRPSSRTHESDGYVQKPARTVNSGRRKMANFCHDCGTKYPVPEAKFCCECGVKRMALA